MTIKLTMVNQAGNPVIFTDVELDSTEIFHESGVLKVTQRFPNGGRTTFYAPGTWKSFEIEVEND